MQILYVTRPKLKNKRKMTEHIFLQRLCAMAVSNYTILAIDKKDSPLQFVELMDVTFAKIVAQKYLSF